jgi:predicted lipoprotein with Yx(FWY)xxD motif
MRRPRTPMLLTLSLVAVVALAACSSDSKSSSSSTTKATTAPAGSGTTAKAANAVVVSATVPKVGAVVVNDQGRTVYTLTDAAGKAVACTGGCLTAWPPVLVVAPATATGSGGVKDVATVTTSDGDQVTINGLPVYTFSGDPGSGVANGEGLASFGGTWHVVKVSGGATGGGTTGGGTTQTTQPDATTTSRYGY